MHLPGTPFLSYNGVTTKALQKYSVGRLHSCQSYAHKLWRTKISERYLYIAADGMPVRFRWENPFFTRPTPSRRTQLVGSFDRTLAGLLNYYIGLDHCN